VSEQGGEPEMLSEGEERLFRFPQPLPGGRTVLVAVSGDGAPVIAAFDVESREVRPLREGSFARYANGHVFWLGAAGTLFVSPFDARAVDLTSAGVEVADGVQPSLQGSYDFAVAENGTVVYSVGTGGASGVETLVWLERSGGTTVVDPALLAQFSDIDNLALSPDGRYIALEVASVDEPIEGGPAQIWIYDLQEAFATRLTFQGTRNAQPRWLPDGRTVAYLSDQGDGPLAIWAQPFDRTGSDALLFQAEWPIEGFDVSPVEGAPLLITDGRTPPDGFYLAPPGTATVEPFLVTEFVETYPRISPDGRWVVYQANESGRNEVYVRSFPEGGRPWPISREGGSVPIWSPSGTEIIYGSPGQLYLIAASVELGDEVRVSAQTEMLQGSPLAAMEFGAPERASVSYDVSLDGQRLLVPMGSGAPMAGSTVGEAGVVLILNIFEELRQRSRG
jgi:dipeptidyl aminopeptidase/acylaminoacyl peptidase